MTTKFRKKPVEIEAVQVTETMLANRDTWPVWLRAAARKCQTELGSVRVCCVEGMVCDEDTRPWGGGLLINTLEGVMRANPGAWVIRGVEGEIYPCKNSIFEATYEAVA